MISTALASVLRSGRADFNARFAEARRLRPDLDTQAFSEFLKGPVDALVQAIATVRPDSVGRTAQALYDLALELVGQRLVGARARNALLEEGWRRILPAVAPLVADAPERIPAAVCNALHQLASTPGARPEVWIATMESLGPRCADGATLLKLGQVAAWRAGMAHFREGALATADTLPPALALAALGARSDRWPDVRDALATNPWFDPTSPEMNGPRLARRAGAFRGLGGLFAVPPQVASAGEHFVVQSGDHCWLLVADAFGATFHRTAPTDFDNAVKRPILPGNWKVQGGVVQRDRTRIDVPDLGEFSSAAANQTTLALTAPLTYAVLLVSLA